MRLILERRGLEAGLPPKLPVQLPDDPRVRDLAVRPATLEQYASLQQRADDGRNAEEDVDVQS